MFRPGGGFLYLSPLAGVTDPQKEVDRMMTKEERRDAKIRGLRELADYLEERPEVPAPYVGFLNAFGDPKELGVIARAMGGFTKEHNGDYLTLVKRFGAGDVELHVNFHSGEVCERVVVGSEFVDERVIPAHTKEVVEWRCPESVLALAREEGPDNG